MSVKKQTDRPDALRSSPVVMTWRRITDIERTKNFASKVLGWPKVGENNYAAIFDAGGVLVGYWTQREDLAKEALATIAGGNACSALNISQFLLVSNPASEFLLATTQLRATARKLEQEQGLLPNIAKSEAGEKISVVDDDGNFTALVRPTGSALAGRGGAKLQSLLTEVTIGGKRASKIKGFHQFIGYSLMVSDLKRSREFYTEVLGLKLLQASRDELKFDIGSAILTLRPEPALGLVRSLQRAGRLLGDWIMFHVDDIKAATSALRKQGAKFPVGIEDSNHGRGAYFNDPDGHLLSVWQPPDQPESIDYFPQLERIIGQTARA